MRIILTAAERAEIEPAQQPSVAGGPEPLCVALMREMFPTLSDDDVLTDEFGDLSFRASDILRAILAHAEVAPSIDPSTGRLIPHSAGEPLPIGNFTLSAPKTDDAE